MRSIRGFCNWRRSSCSEGGRAICLDTRVCRYVASKPVSLFFFRGLGEIISMRFWAMNWTAGMALVCLAASSMQAQAYRAPRGGDGHADLSGIWEALNTANWDLEDHSPQA